MKTDRPTSDCRRMLRILYEHTQYPAGCRVEAEAPYRGVFIPNQHLGIMRLVRKELIARQISKGSVTEEMIVIYENTIKVGQIRNIFELRDRINGLLKSQKVLDMSGSAAMLAVTNNPKYVALAHPRDVDAYECVATKEILWNNRQDHLFIMDENCVFDALNGVRYAKYQLRVHKLKEKPNE